jgi:hypothetical protein
MSVKGILTQEEANRFFSQASVPELVLSALSCSHETGPVIDQRICGEQAFRYGVILQHFPAVSSGCAGVAS